MRARLPGMLALALVAAAPSAGAATPLPANISADTTYGPTGNPYLVTADVTVAAGVTLTFEAGCTVRFDDGRKLTVQGTLVTAGTAGAPVTFQSSTGTARSSWSRIELVGGGGASLTGAVVEHAIFGLDVQGTGAVTVTSSTFRTNNQGVRVGVGSPTVSASVFLDNVWGLAVSPSTAVEANATATGSLFDGNGAGVVAQAGPAPATLHLDHCTLIRNWELGGLAFTLTTAAARITMANSIVVRNNQGFTARENSTIYVTHSALWSNLYGDAQYPNPSAPTINTNAIVAANPLFVSDTDLRLTHRSPCRMSGKDGSDLGAFPYAGAQTPGYHGTYWSSTTLPAGVHVVEGDITIPPGKTLTLAPGAELVFPYDVVDLMRAGEDPDRIELRIEGRLTAVGTAGNPIRIRGGRGLVFLPTSTALRLQHFELTDSAVGIDFRSASTDAAISDGRIIDPRIGVDVSGGALLTVERLEIRRAIEVGAHVDDGALRLVNAIVAEGNGDGLRVTTERDRAWLNAYHCTIHGNRGAGLNTQDRVFGATIFVDNSLITGNGRGVEVANYLSENSLIADVWGNGVDFAGTTAGPRVISADPLYVGAPGDLRLRAYSPCVDRPSTTVWATTDILGVARPQGAGYDWGAYEVVPACGDGAVNAPGEACDDGNAVDTDACLTGCILATCGDGVVQAGVEECDDANAVETDACLAGCVAAACGDGVVQEGVEPCDDGNDVETDACLTGCVVAACGDGVVQEGVEPCDDGNDVETDACLTGCVAAACGDGTVQESVEACDDGNLLAGDGCDAACAIEPPESTPESGCGCGTSGPLPSLLWMAAALAWVPRRRRS